MNRIAIIGNYLPRQCGIATFTTDLSQAISSEFPALESFVLAMNDAGRRYEYPGRVQFEIAAPDPAAYQRAAAYLNVNQVDLVSVQHEFGIFGGPAGRHVLDLLEPDVDESHVLEQGPEGVGPEVPVHVVQPRVPLDQGGVVDLFERIDREDDPAAGFQDPAALTQDLLVVLDVLDDELHALGVRVMLNPHVDVRDGSWRGQFAPADPAAAAAFMPLSKTAVSPPT